MTTTTINTYYDITASCYVKYEESNGWTVIRRNGVELNPSDLIGTDINPAIFATSEALANMHIVRREEIIDRLIESGRYTADEWYDLDPDEQTDIIEDYGIGLEMQGNEYCDESLRQETLTFTIDDRGIITSVETTAVEKLSSAASYRAVMGERLRDFRLDLGLSAYRVAQRGNIAISQVAAVENGSSNYTIDTLLGYVRGCNLYMYFATKGRNAAKPHDFKDLAAKGQQNHPDIN